MDALDEKSTARQTKQIRRQSRILCHGRQKNCPFDFLTQRLAKTVGCSRLSLQATALVPKTIVSQVLRSMHTYIYAHTERSYVYSFGPLN